jgi:hypothetical protein
MEIEIVDNVLEWSWVKDELEFYAKQILVPIHNKLHVQNESLTKKEFYILRISKQPNRTNYHKFQVSQIQEISRKLVNGLRTFGSKTNREFWKENFLGGIRTSTIVQDNKEDFPIFTLNYLLFSDKDNLDVKIKNNLITRIKFIDSTLKVEFNYIGGFKDIIIDEMLKPRTEVDFDSNGIEKLGDENKKSIIKNYFQKPTFFGDLFRSKTINYVHDINKETIEVYH